MKNIDLYTCITYAANNKELIAQFDRLHGANLSFEGTPLDLMIDEASGRQVDDIKKFIEFVETCIYIPLLYMDKQETE